MTGRRYPPLPITLSQAEEGSATATASEREKQCQKAKENLEVGAAVAVFGLAVLLGWLCLPKEAKHPGNVRLTVSLLLSFATFLSGKALMLLSLNMLGREDLVSGCHRAAANCLLAACAVMSVLTLLSLLAILPGGVNLYIGLAVVTVIVVAAAGVHWYLRRRADGDGMAAAQEEEELDAASKTTSCITNSAFGGLVGVLFSASKISGAAPPAAVDRAAHAAIFFMFATAIVGMFVTMVSKKLPEITSPRCRRILITAIRLANAFLLCSLACAAFAAAFVVLRYRVFAAFAPLAITGTLGFLLRHCVVDHGRARGANLLRNQEARLKAMEDIASKVTAATLGAIMSILGGSLGEKDHDEWCAMDVFMLVLTSAFVSGFGFMVLAAAPGSARAHLAPVARVLVWSTVALFAATAVVVYGVEAWAM